MGCVSNPGLKGRPPRAPTTRVEFEALLSRAGAGAERMTGNSWQENEEDEKVTVGLVMMLKRNAEHPTQYPQRAATGGPRRSLIVSATSAPCIDCRPWKRLPYQTR